jgi:integrase
MPRVKKQHLKRRKDGRYCCTYHGKQFMGCTEDEAFAKRDEYKRLEAAGEYQRENPLVKDYAEAWLKTQATGAAYQTQKEKASLVKKLTETLGDLRLREVRVTDIKALYADHFAGYSSSYIRSATQIYRAIFDAAVGDDIIDKNPARHKSAKPHRGTESDTRAITDQERSWICTLCTDHRAHAVVMAMLYAGLRPQEAKALDIDRDVVGDTIRVRETVHLVSANRYESSTKLKTAYSGREIPLFSPLKKALEGRHGLLITSADGKPVTVQAWKSAWESYRSCLETAINGCQERWYGRRRQDQGKQLPPFVHVTFTPYDLRHSFCTMCRDNGVELNTCIHWMGHSDAKMILKIYDEYSRYRSQKEAEKLEKTAFNMQTDMQSESEQPKQPVPSTK